METDKDHIHYMIETEPNINLSDFVRTIKSYTTYHIWKKYRNYLSRCFWKEHTFWTDGYFAKTFGCVRFVYNRMLAEKIAYYEETGKSLTVTPAKYKTEFTWLKEVDSLALANAQMNLQSAYRNFFRDKSVGFPKYKSKKSNHKSYTTNNQKGSVAIVGKYIKLPKIGYVRLKQHRDFSGTIKSATVSQVPSGKYYVSILVETEHTELPHTEQRVGLDLGIKDLCITSDGNKYENPKTLRKYEKQLGKLQRQLAHKNKGSANFYKMKRKIARCYEKITNIRKNNLHKISHQLISDNQVIVSENLAISNMIKNHSLAKSIADCSWYELTRQLEYKAEWNHRQYIKIDTFYASSQLCGCCGCKNTNVKNLEIRKWSCPVCGTEHDRDINASQNILAEGLRMLSV